MVIVSDRLDQIAAVLAELGVGNGDGDGSLPGAVVGRKFSFAYTDFTVDMGSGAFASAVFYTLEPDEQLLFMTVRITELFDDTAEFGGALFIDDDTSAGFAGIPLGFQDVPAPVQGVVGLFGSTLGDIKWSDMLNAVEVDTAAVGIRYGSINWNADGSQGAVDVTIYTCTPIPPA